MVNMQKLQALFLQECVDHLRVLEAWGNQSDNIAITREEIDAAFRAIHSIKGGAGMFGFDRAQPLSQAYETLLDGMREGTLELTRDIRNILVKATDCLTDLVEAEQKGIVLPPNFETLVTQTMCRLAGLEVEQNNVVPEEATVPTSDPDVESRTVCIHFMPLEHLLRRACEPLHVIRQLKDLGKLTVNIDGSRMPDFAAHDPSDAWLGWQIAMETTRPLSALQAAFEFVAEDALVTVTEMASLNPADDNGHIGVPSTGDWQSPPSAGEPAKQETTEAASISIDTASPVSDPQAPVFRRRVSDNSDTSSIRVDVSRIDRLVNLAGEIAISQALVAQLIDQSLFAANPQLFQELSQLLVHTQSLQENVMAIRAQPVRTVFERMPRLVRDLAEQLDKDIKLHISGETTEIDKTVIEQLSDPIIHMLRNCCDHGIETRAKRIQLGKAVTGQIWLHAEQRGSNIVIEISDDGKGLNRANLLERAISRGIIAPGSNLQPEEVDNLIFVPGFSTADKITTLSGRGVGLDVVKRNVQKFGGKVSIHSQQGKGTTLTLVLPLTLAVLEGMILRCGNENFVVPVNHIQECRADWKKDAGFVPGTGHVLNFRGRHIAVHDLRELFSTNGPRQETTTAIIAETDNHNLAAFIADEIIGQQQVVIKNIATHAEPIKGIAGATVLGDGRVALILDPAEIVKLRPNSPISSEQDFRRNVA